MVKKLNKTTLTITLLGYIVKFEDFLEISAEGDFTLKDIDPREQTFVFESAFGDRIHMRRLPCEVTADIQPWIVLVNGDKVEFDNPAQLLSLNTIITGLCSKSLQQVIDEGKKKAKQ